ncbi:PRC and DUF2382 domain-containing protein [Corynebacterium breve]|uniref:PRC and DUF2382 domain-containing protein n=1 Tax=Corynebacterium breve TaxID=3049799 RepID=A0ABY8VF81_9CORY|nr:PRC and DUF2382 domain-containing protein [Corynebacterium breve]WIM67420.1 PRC and DUF2382 domain-containing protein [Corynebacterium breve]
MNKNYSIDDLARATAYDRNGDKLGSVRDVYVNDASGQPDFVDVNHGLFNMSSSIVPLRGHSLRDGELHLAFDKDRIKDAPNWGTEGHLSQEDQAAFYRHYGVDSVENTTHYDVDPRANDRDFDRDRTNLRDGDLRDGEIRDNDREFDRDRTDLRDGDDATLVRSEERLNVDKEREETGHVRLRKHVVHDTETVEVPVEREEVRIEREPISGNEADRLRGANLGDDEASVTLHEERVNVTKESVPVEKVSLDKETVRDTETVTEDVAKERIETEGVDGVKDLDGDRDLRDRR